MDYGIYLVRQKKKAVRSDVGTSGSRYGLYQQLFPWQNMEKNNGYIEKNYPIRVREMYRSRNYRVVWYISIAKLE